MRQIRTIDRSVLSYLRTQLVNIWGSHLSVKDRYPNDLENIDLPMVTSGHATNARLQLEMGTEAGVDSMYWHFMVFARGKGERDDISCDIKRLLASGCGIYDYSSGSQGDKIGYMNFKNINIKPIISAAGSNPASMRNRSVVVAKAEVAITGA